MAELRLVNLSKSFAGRKAKAPVHALHNLSITVPSGKCLALLGPSGAGKSTALRVIAGLESPDAGDILLDGQSILPKRAAERQVGMAFQYPALLPQLSVLENLSLGPKLRGERVNLEALITTLGIEHLLDRKPETLSGGEQQRIALGRALASKPRLLLLDEPLANLDPLSRADLRHLIRRVQRQLQVTTIYVTHDQSEAAGVADDIALMRAGRLEQIDSAEQLYREPANLFVARFFGRDGLNTLKGTVRRHGDRWFIQAGDTRLRIAPMDEQFQDKEFVAAFRPSATRAFKDGDSSWRIEEVRKLGWTNLLCFAHGILCETPDPNNFAAGENVTLEAGRVLLFDLATEKRIA